MAGGRIVNRAEYEAACRWWEEKRRELDDPLLTDEEREKLQRKLDFVHAEIERYLVSLEAAKDPETRRLAFEQGVTFYDLDDQGDVIGIAKPEEPEPVEPDPEPQAESTAESLADWLEDE